MKSLDKFKAININPGDAFTCISCGKITPLDAYVAAHWFDKITHTCECGQRVNMRNGILKPLKTKAKKSES